MKERPILMSTPMVQSILDDTKTQTRRLIKPQPVLSDGGIYEGKGYVRVDGHRWQRQFAYEFARRVMLEHAHDLLEGARDRSLIAYKANFHPDWMEYAKEKYGYKWKPSLFMPREAARIFLKVTEVRVERLAEGIECHIPAPGDGHPTYKSYLGPNPYYSPKLSFKSLWQSINGKKCPWDSNPYVWVITFKKI